MTREKSLSFTLHPVDTDTPEERALKDEIDLQWKRQIALREEEKATAAEYRRLAQELKMLYFGLQLGAIYKYRVFTSVWNEHTGVLQANPKSEFSLFQLQLIDMKTGSLKKKTVPVRDEGELSLVQEQKP